LAKRTLWVGWSIGTARSKAINRNTSYWSNAGWTDFGLRRSSEAAGLLVQGPPFQTAVWGDTSLGYSSTNNYRSSFGFGDWNPEPENRLVASRVEPCVLAKLKVVKSEIARKVSGPELARHEELTKSEAATSKL
jgi:hypothetical protein